MVLFLLYCYYILLLFYSVRHTINTFSPLYTCMEAILHGHVERRDDEEEWGVMNSAGGGGRRPRLRWMDYYEKKNPRDTWMARTRRKMSQWRIRSRNNRHRSVGRKGETRLRWLNGWQKDEVPTNGEDESDTKKMYHCRSCHDGVFAENLQTSASLLLCNQ